MDLETYSTVEAKNSRGKSWFHIQFFPEHLQNLHAVPFAWAIFTSISYPPLLQGRANVPQVGSFSYFGSNTMPSQVFHTPDQDEDIWPHTRWVSSATCRSPCCCFCRRNLIKFWLSTRSAFFRFNPHEPIICKDCVAAYFPDLSREWPILLYLFLELYLWQLSSQLPTSSLRAKKLLFWTEYPIHHNSKSQFLHLLYM